MLLAMALTAGLAVIRSNTSRIIVFNETGKALAAVRLQACGQSRTFNNVPVDGSVRWKLEKHGAASEVSLEVATEPPLQWHGSYVECRGGYAVTLRIWQDGTIEEHRQISFWQRMLKGAPAVNQ